MADNPLDHATACADHCDRRDFFRQSAAVIAVTAFFGRELGALPVRMIAAAGRSGRRLTYALPTADGVMIDKAEGVIIARSAGRVLALSLTCPHQNTALRWQQKAGEFQCTKHKSRYKPDGIFIAGRATRAMDRFAITREGASVVVDAARLFRADEQTAEWTAAVLSV